MSAPIHATASLGTLHGGPWFNVSRLREVPPSRWHSLVAGLKEIHPHSYDPTTRSWWFPLHQLSQVQKVFSWLDLNLEVSDLYAPRGIGVYGRLWLAEDAPMLVVNAAYSALKNALRGDIDELQKLEDAYERIVASRQQVLGGKL